MHSPELQSRIALWRQRCAEGLMTQDDYREAIALLREGRLNAAHAAASSKAKASPKKPPADGDSLLDELDGL